MVAATKNSNGVGTAIRGITNYAGFEDWLLFASIVAPVPGLLG